MTKGVVKKTPINNTAKKTPKREPKAGKVSGLPTKPRPKNLDLADYIVLIYGRAGIGKTTAMASWPGTLFFSAERISKALEVYDYNWENGGITSWRVLTQGVKDLKGSDRFGTVAIDTVDVAYQYCLEHVCKRKGITHPGDLKDYGKTWGEIRDEFTKAIRDIIDTGRGVVLSSHEKDEVIKSFSDAEFSRIRPTAPNQAYGVLKQITDFIVYVEYIRDKNGDTKRVMFTEGNDLFDAKNPHKLPPILTFPEPPGSVYEVLSRALNGDKSDAINPADIQPARDANSDFSAELINKAHTTRKEKGKAKRKEK